MVFECAVHRLATIGVALFLLPLAASGLHAQNAPGAPISEEVAQALRLETQAAELAKQGRAEEAERLYRQSLAIVEEALPKGPILAGSLNNIGNFYLGQRRLEDAVPLLERAVAIFTAAYGDNNRESATAIGNLARTYHAMSRYEDATPLYERMIAITENLLGPEHYAVALSLADLAQVKFAQRRFTDSETLLTRAIAVAEKSTGAESDLSVRMMDYMISVLTVQGRKPEADALLKKAQAIVDRKKNR